MPDHPNKMTVWDEIRCQRGHEKHETLPVHVNLHEPHGYRDFPRVPHDLAVEFDMEVWDPITYPVDGGPYCPAHDAVSATIVSHGIWEPRETILALRTFSESPRDSTFFDMGAQLGWYSILAQACGVQVLAFEADEDNARILEGNLDRPSLLFQTPHTVIQGRIGVDERFEPKPYEHGQICMVKIDLEGAENKAIGRLRPSIDAGLVDHMLIEISPVFDDYYGDLVLELMEDFDVFRLPEKGETDWDGTVKGGMIQLRGPKQYILDFVNGLHQEDFWFVRKGL